MTPSEGKDNGFNDAIGDERSPKLVDINTVLGKSFCVSNCEKK